MRQRARSHSVTVGVHDAKAEKVGLLQALQQHVRARHAFATADSTSARVLDAAAEDEQASARPEDVDDPLVAERLAEQEELVTAFQQATAEADADKLLKDVTKLRESTHAHDTAVYNEAMYALHHTRAPRHPLRIILELYNHMVARSVVPDVQTYSILIVALTDRDRDNYRRLDQLEEGAQRLITLGQFTDRARRTYDHRVHRLRAENNLSSAMLLFQAACLISGNNISIWVYNGLLRSCAYYGNVDAALRVFGHLERQSPVKPILPVYRNLISTYDKNGDINGAKEVFTSLRKAAKSGDVFLEDTQPDEFTQPKWRGEYIGVWNSMITAYFSHGLVSDAIGLLEEMLGPDASAEFECGDIPAPSSGTYTRVIKGFIKCGDIDSALVWFNKLLEQPQASVNPYASSLQPTKPNSQAWSAMVDALVKEHRVDDLNRLVDRAYRENLYSFHPLERAMIVHENVRYFDLNHDIPQEAVLAELDRLCDRHIRFDVINGPEVSGRFWDVSEEIEYAYMTVVQLRLKLGDYDGALNLIDDFVKAVSQDCSRTEATKELPSSIVLERATELRRFVSSFSMILLPTPETKVPLRHLMRLATMADAVAMSPRQPIASYYVGAYVEAPQVERDALIAEEWYILLHAAINIKWLQVQSTASYTETLMKSRPLPPLDLLAMIEDFARRGFDTESLPTGLRTRMGNALAESYDLRDESVSARLLALGSSYGDLITEKLNGRDHRVRTPESVDEVPFQLPETAPVARVRIDLNQGRYVDEYATPSSGVTPAIAYERFMAGTQIGLYPRIEVVGRLINQLGRVGELEKVHSVYQFAQLVLGSMEADKQAQSSGWFQVEDSMIIALAHAGDLEAAHIHRMRILEQGGCPSADAYGALIERVSNTTDDTNNAWQLFQEAIAHDVAPNIYLYNTIISKLAKARKADHALELFAQMKAHNLRPTSVTYGALIAACCRVGDAQSAEVLFEEMTTQPNFKPRVPPYNTMMQLYTLTKPDRARVLHFHNAMLQANVRPTAHTYKVRSSLSSSRPDN